MTEINDRERAVFEAGIKLGALYHQFTGTPIHPNMLADLASMIEKSIGLQPFVKNITVTIDAEMVKKKLNSEFGYCELEGRMLNVNLQVEYGDVLAHVEMSYDEENDYPLMSIRSIEKL